MRPDDWGPAVEYLKATQDLALAIERQKQAERALTQAQIYRESARDAVITARARFEAAQASFIAEEEE